MVNINRSNTLQNGPAVQLKLINDIFRSEYIKKKIDDLVAQLVCGGTSEKPGQERSDQNEVKRNDSLTIGTSGFDESSSHSLSAFNHVKPSPSEEI